MRRFERKPGMQAEALDCLVYAWAARHVVAIDLDRRENELREVVPSASAPASDRAPLGGVSSPVSAWRLIFMTGLTEWEIPEPIPNDPATRFLCKPFGARVIVDYVCNLLAPRFDVGVMTSEL